MCPMNRLPGSTPGSHPRIPSRDSPRTHLTPCQPLPGMPTACSLARTLVPMQAGVHSSRLSPGLPSFLLPPLGGFWEPQQGKRSPLLASAPTWSPQPKRGRTPIPLHQSPFCLLLNHIASLPVHSASRPLSLVLPSCPSPGPAVGLQSSAQTGFLC